ncbi:MAG: hypothetical protein M0Z50_07990 [Planctomycetia bacterium]|nr:hypothetical protein [Planctomycetia bacterium]
MLRSSWLVLFLTAFVALAAVSAASMSRSMKSGRIHIIYQDHFTGSSKPGTLNGARPTVNNGPGKKWTAGRNWSASGFINANGADGRDTAFLRFTPKRGEIYTLSVTMSLVKGANRAAYIAVGFLKNVHASNVYTGWDTRYFSASTPVALPWALARLNGNVTTFEGPGIGGTIGGYQIPHSNGKTLTKNVLSIQLNTSKPKWTYQVFDNGVAVMQPSTLLVHRPVITAAGMQGASIVGTVSNFSLTAQTAH